MKTLLFALLFFASTLSAQDTTMVSVPRAALTAQQVQQLNTQNVKDKAEAYGAWVGVGKEIGEAVNSSLSAISDNAAKFADTKVGKLSMAIVVWKVVGRDILGLMYAAIIVFVGLPLLIWSYRKYLPNVVLEKSVTKDDVTTNTYRGLSYDERSAREVSLIIHAAATIVLLVALSVALFA